jgi:hypothetical protein
MAEIAELVVTEGAAPGAAVAAAVRTDAGFRTGWGTAGTASTPGGVETTVTSQHVLTPSSSITQKRSVYVPAASRNMLVVAAIGEPGVAVEPAGRDVTVHE